MLVNLTPHAINIHPKESGSTPHLLPKCDNPPRLAEKPVPAGAVDGVPVVKKTFDKTGCHLPPPADGTFFVVPLAIAQAFPERTDLLVTNDPIRDANGVITGCHSLARIS